MVRKSKEDAEATRQLLLDKAEAVFEQRGVSRTTLQDIAVAAGLTRGAIYWHFKDKADLFQAMMDRVCLPCEAQFEATLGGAPFAGGWRWQLERLGVDVLRRLADDARTRRVFTIAMHRTELAEDLGAVRDRRLQIVQAFLGDLGAHFAAAAAAGDLAPGLDADAAAIGYFAVLDGLMHNWTLMPERFDLVSVGRASLAAYLRGLAREPGPTDAP